MEVATGLGEVAEFFKVLGNESRLGLLYLISQQPRTVGQLAEATGMSQPLVSQHLRTLRQARLIAGTRIGREIPYRLADNHVVHVMADALLHVQELEAGQPADPTTTTATPHQGEDMTNDTHTEHHTVTEHEHGTDCGHESVQHDGHLDYVHGAHRHALHDDHYDEHESVAEHTVADHAHGADCGHESVQHGDHVDYVHDGHKHAEHSDHYDEH